MLVYSSKVSLGVVCSSCITDVRPCLCILLLHSPPGCSLEAILVTQSGDSPVIPLVESDKLPTEIKDRWKVVDKMEMVTQYTFAGDYTGMATYRCDSAHIDSA